MPMLDRRRTLATLGAALLLPPAAGRADDPAAALARRLGEIERASGGRLGVAMRDTGTGLTVGHRADECFPLCSTFKLLAAGAALARVDAGRESLERRVPYTAADLVDYSPVTKARVGEGGMALGALCEAALTLSDNTAGNLILASLGGPAGLNAWLRGLGDPVTRLDRIEPDLNEARPGDARDTTTPAAMLADLDRLALGTALTSASRGTLVAWLRANRTGGARLRAGLPPAWQVGDKTGSGDRGTTNDVGLLWPPGGAAPILVAAYLTETDAPQERRNASLAEVGRAVASHR
ncbi:MULTISPECIES: class A beta-lactamase [Methylobacterium]